MGNNITILVNGKPIPTNNYNVEERVEMACQQAVKELANSSSSSLDAIRYGHYPVLSQVAEIFKKAGYFCYYRTIDNYSWRMDYLLISKEPRQLDRYTRKV